MRSRHIGNPLNAYPESLNAHAWTAGSEKTIGRYRRSTSPSIIDTDVPVTHHRLDRRTGARSSLVRNRVALFQPTRRSMSPTSGPDASPVQGWIEPGAPAWRSLPTSSGHLTRPNFEYRTLFTLATSQSQSPPAPRRNIL
jgi:hypothetical protein